MHPAFSLATSTTAHSARLPTHTIMNLPQNLLPTCQVNLTISSTAELQKHSGCCGKAEAMMFMTLFKLRLVPRMEGGLEATFLSRPIDQEDKTNLKHTLQLDQAGRLRGATIKITTRTLPACLGMRQEYPTRDAADTLLSRTKPATILRNHRFYHEDKESLTKRKLIPSSHLDVRKQKPKFKITDNIMERRQ